MEFEASNGFTVKHVNGSLELEVGNVFLNEERAEALFEYFTSSAFTGHPGPKASPEISTAVSSALSELLNQIGKKGS